MIIGSHVGFGKDQLLGSVKEAISYNANTFMFYTGAPQNTLRKSIDSSLTNEAKKLMQENNILIREKNDGYFFCVYNYLYQLRIQILHYLPRLFVILLNHFFGAVI